MTRDYSHLFPDAPGPAPLSALARLGWRNHFAAQVDAEEMAQTPPVRIAEVHRSGLIATGDGIQVTVPPDDDLTVGDWVLWNEEAPNRSVRLERTSLIKRRAAGRISYEQLIAANIDTVFVVTSCNADFNVARLERFLALAFEADVTPVIVLTKADQTDPAPYLEKARAISDKVEVLAVNAKDEGVAATLAPWTKPGQTVAFLGTSGVGKSTLTNALTGGEIETAAIREDDARGRHTTRHRQLYFTPEGLGIIDTPGMRELQLTDAAAGISELFEDIEELATTCKFRNCAHESEPGCAVNAALADGTLDPARLDRWRKLIAEEAHNSESVAERRTRERGFSKHVKRVMKDKPNRR